MVQKLALKRTVDLVTHSTLLNTKLLNRKKKKCDSFLCLSKKGVRLGNTRRLGPITTQENTLVLLIGLNRRARHF